MVFKTVLLDFMTVNEITLYHGDGFFTYPFGFRLSWQLLARVSQSVLMLIALLLGYVWKYSIHWEIGKIMSFCSSKKCRLVSSF